eukprot:scaffold12582_cov126-Isochrysis_galbana.AAC.4
MELFIMMLRSRSKLMHYRAGSEPRPCAACCAGSAQATRQTGRQAARREERRQRSSTSEIIRQTSGRNRRLGAGRIKQGVSWKTRTPGQHRTGLTPSAYKARLV